MFAAKPTPNKYTYSFDSVKMFNVMLIKMFEFGTLLG